jgi:hypothetical protein
VELKATYSPHESHNVQTAMQVLGMGYDRKTPRFVAYFDKRGFRKLIPCSSKVTRDGRTLDVWIEAERLIFEYALALEVA